MSASDTNELKRQQAKVRNTYTLKTDVWQAFKTGIIILLTGCGKKDKFKNSKEKINSTSLNSLVCQGFSSYLS